MADPIKDKFEWTHFNNEQYEKYLIAIGKMKEYKILYKFYLGNNITCLKRTAIKRVIAYDKDHAREKFPLWDGLIIRIWEA